MTDLSAEYKALAEYRPTHKVRFVTAASLFDGHDAAINIMRRILQSMGAEVVHLGHNRSVDEVVTAALQEDVQGIAISSYQGGHVEYFKYMVDLLRQRGGEHIQVFGGGGGVIAIKAADPVRYASFELKIDQVNSVGAKTVSMTCSNCRLQFTDCVQHFNLDVKVAGLSQMVADALVE